MVKLKEERMKERSRSLLGTTTLVLLVLVLVLMFFVSSLSHFARSGIKSTSGSGRKLLSGTIQASQPRDMRVDGTAMAVKQAGVSFRKIPPSRSNPTQNKSRPRVNGPGKQ